MAAPRILVTNHDLTYLDMIRDLLNEEGYPEVFCVPSDEAFSTILRERIEIVLVDINIAKPDDGWQLIAKLRLEPSTAELPVIICSTDPTIPKQKEEMLTRLQCYYLEKPFNLNTLFELVARVHPGAASNDSGRT